MKRSKLLVTVLIVIMAIAMCLSACTKTEPAEKTSEKPATKAPEATKEKEVEDEPVDPFAEKVDLTWFAYGWANNIPKTDTLTEKKLEEKFNCSIEVVPVQGSDLEQFNVYFSSGDTADVIECADGLRMARLINQDMIRSIDFDMYTENMPNHVKFMLEVIQVAYPDFTVDDILATFGKNGTFYGVPFQPLEMNAYPMAYRKDWAEAAGYTKTPETIADFKEMSLAIMQADPAGTKPMGFSNYWGVKGFEYFLAAYNVPGQWGYYADENGKVYAPYASTDFQDFCVEMAQWYKEGIIDPEFKTDDRGDVVSKWAEGRLLSITNNFSWFWEETGNDMFEVVYNNYPDAEPVMVEGLAGPKHPGGPIRLSINSRAHAHQTLFGTDTTDAQVLRYMAIQESFADSIMNDPEVKWAIEIMYGPYTAWNNGALDRTEFFSDYDRIVDEGLYLFTNIPLKMSQYCSHEQSIEANRIAYDVPAIPTDFNFKTGGMVIEDCDTEVTDLGTAYLEYQTWFIDGTKDPVADWDEYIAKLEAAGLAKVVAEHQKIYDANN